MNLVVSTSSFASSFIPAGLAFDPERNTAPALHVNLALPLALTLPIKLFVRRRDAGYLADSPLIPDTDPVHRRALRDFGVYTVPGWDNYAFGARYSDYAELASGRGLHHISVSEDGRIAARSLHVSIGSCDPALAAEWIHELPTVVYRTWYALRLQEHATGSPPERELFLGHSKGGLLVYLLACLVRARSHGRLNEFAANLRDSAGRPVLDRVPPKILDDVAGGLADAVFGTIGSPLYGIAPEFSAVADFGIGGLSFNGLTGGSARYYDPRHLKNIHRMTGYAPNEVLHFVVTSSLTPPDPRAFTRFVTGLKAAAGLARSPIKGGADALFDGASRLIKPDLDHDGVAPASYPEPFEHHLRIPGATHTDQVASVAVLRGILDFLVERGLIG